MTRIRFTLAQVKTFPGRKTRRLRVLRQSNPHPARNSREVRDGPLHRESHGCPLPTLRLRERLQAAPGGSRPNRTDPKDARMGGARVGARPVAALASRPLAAFGVSVSRVSGRRAD